MVEGSLTTESSMRYWQPAPALRTLVSGYHLYRIGPSDSHEHEDVFQPAGPILRVSSVDEDGGGWRVRPPGAEWQNVPSVALFGPTSGVTWSKSGPGETIGFGILPRGWSRLSRIDASKWADRVAEPGDAMRLDLRTLASALASRSGDDDIPRILDAALAGVSPRRGVDEDLIAAFEDALLRREIDSVEELSIRLGKSRRNLERLANRVFGFSPKKLIRRARFLRSIHALANSGGSGSAIAIDQGYTDYSHFIRDSHAFLGMSPHAFLKLDNPLLRQSLALRKKVLGSPAQALASGSG